MTNRVVLFIMDSVGIGELPDAKDFGDVGANTLGNIIEQEGGIELPNLLSLGLGNIGIKGLEPIVTPLGAFGKSDEVSNGKDTTTGHWELSGLHLTQPFNTFPEGFPIHIIEKYEEMIGRKILGNKPASGTAILDELGEEHMKTGHPIVYTSADSVFQIAAHEEVIPLEQLYDFCKKARELMMGDVAVARIIARPFVGKPGEFVRTPNRKDYSLDPFGETVLDTVKNSGLDVIAVGKINDIFNGKGITEYAKTKNNIEGIEKTIEYLNKGNKGIIFTNLVDFDSEYGHRRDAAGYRKALEEMDKKIPEILNALKPNDIIIFTADHGNDPTFKGTDHTREYIPILIYGQNIKAGANIGVRKSFADIAATIADLLNVTWTGKGESFKNLIIK
ncbi:phosphopentomutase [Serpentinicella alkaliphila]|uniref:Phosphopentomutase n=1 Tax=Serpentinicella alkaliphila TaxID=1734049 RepID=A0A4R2U5G4_9FIRM|nr:phosphopentomutase [Serpentinicella alkaliphila]QUH26591.1 phosphopentomutase [Serpentinicella alkaliphila]TCQ02943.1 phosphopentomutase [Serpentinicella alkaliphila]